MIIIDSLRMGDSPDILREAYPSLTPERLAAVQELLRIHPDVTEEELTTAIITGKGLRYFMKNDDER